MREAHFTLPPVHGDDLVVEVNKPPFAHVLFLRGDGFEMTGIILALIFIELIRRQI